MAAFKKDGYEVRKLSRTAVSPYEFRLGQPVDPKALEGVDILVHCAYDFGLPSWTEIEKINVGGTGLLFEAARRAEVPRIILVSSIASYEGCPSLYGKAKLECEKLAKDCSAAIVRPGLIYGEGNRGVYASLENWVRKLPVIPLLYPNPSLYLCRIENICSLMIEISKTRDIVLDIIYAAYPKPVTFKDLIVFLQKTHNRNQLIVPVLWRLPWSILKCLELFNIDPPIRSDALVGLMKGNPEPDFQSSDRYQVTFQNYLPPQAAS